MAAPRPAPSRPASASSPAPPRPARSWLSRLGWLALIWAASVLALAAVAFLFRFAMGLAGLTA